MIKDMQQIVIDSSKKYLNPNQKKLNINGIKNDISRALKNYIKKETNREPMIMPVVMILE
jgi:mRNA degradation ribonuclease J1/J2